MRFKALFVAAGVIAASSFSTSVTFGPGSTADAADAEHLPAQEAVTVPEFVPILNFSQFVLATDQFGEANRARAAEMLSAKFAAASDGPHVLLNQGPQPTPAIVESAMSFAVPDPDEKPAEAFADPVKVATAISKATETPAAAPEDEAEAKVPEAKTSARARSEKRFRPAMGLGMAVDQDDTAMQWWFSSGKPKKKSADRSQIRRVATTDGSGHGSPPNAAAAKAAATPKEDFQIGVPGQSMEPTISTCATRERTCWGKFCGC